MHTALWAKCRNAPGVLRRIFFFFGKNEAANLLWFSHLGFSILSGSSTRRFLLTNEETCKFSVTVVVISAPPCVRCAIIYALLVEIDWIFRIFSFTITTTNYLRSREHCVLERSIDTSSRFSWTRSLHDHLRPWDGVRPKYLSLSRKPVLDDISFAIHYEPCSIKRSLAR